MRQMRETRQCREVRWGSRMEERSMEDISTGNEGFGDLRRRKTLQQFTKGIKFCLLLDAQVHTASLEGTVFLSMLSYNIHFSNRGR